MNHSLSVLFVSGKADTAFEYIGTRLSNLKFTDILDILLLSASLFLLWMCYRKTKTFRYSVFAVGILSFLIFLTSLCRLYVVSDILSYILRIGLLGAIIILETRMFDKFAKSGNISFSNALEWVKKLFKKEKSDSADVSCIESICKAAVDLSRTKTGGLIVIERKNKLDDLIHTGVDIDAVVSPYLIRNIFYEGAPLHDGALIIRDERIYAAGCILPITHRLDVNPDLGTRHRAAIGMSESSDAVIIVISEESGVISVACNSEFTRDYQYSTLKNELIRLIEGASEEREDDNEA